MYLCGDGTLEGFIGGCFIRNVALGSPVMFRHLRGKSRNCGTHTDNYKTLVRVLCCGNICRGDLLRFQDHSKYKYAAFAGPDSCSPLVNVLILNV